MKFKVGDKVKRNTVFEIKKIVRHKSGMTDKGIKRYILASLDGKTVIDTNDEKSLELV